MKFLLIGSCLLFLCTTAIATEVSNTENSKDTEKSSYPKKVNSTKKNFSKSALKRVADITEKFRDLPTEDLAFIKELDKQFKLHGGKVKIKVENRNVTETKTNKRTIDRELGYGYQYNPPKFMFYPYSQQNIGDSDSNYFLTGSGKTEVSIEPSFSYELKSPSYITHNEPEIDVPKSKHQQETDNFRQKQQQYEEPIIVLRIPGPAKYASHLQMLLQKYLEIRATQYLHILEEAEHSSIDPVEQRVPIPETNDYTQVHAVQYPEISDVYHSYKHRHFSHQKQPQIALQNKQPHYSFQQSVEEQNTPQNNHQGQYQDQQYQQEYFQYQQRGGHPQFYYTHQQQYDQPDIPAANTYQQVFLVSMVEPDNDASLSHKDKQLPIIDHAQSSQNEHSLTSPIAENNPNPSHTKVVFTYKSDRSTHDYQMYQLPSIKPNDRHASASTPDYHQDFQQQKDRSINYHEYYNPDDKTSADEVTIAQSPYNYHAHTVKARASGGTTHSRRAAINNEAERNLQKIREYVLDKLGAETGSAVEFKTTQVIDD